MLLILLKIASSHLYEYFLYNLLYYDYIDWASGVIAHDDQSIAWLVHSSCFARGKYHYIFHGNLIYCSILVPHNFHPPYYDYLKQTILNIYWFFTSDFIIKLKKKYYSISIMTVYV